MSESTHEKVASELSRQGTAADTIHNMRLNFGEDPIFVHLATMCTAAALAGREWSISGKRNRLKLSVPLPYRLFGVSLTGDTVTQDLTLFGAVKNSSLTNKNSVYPASVHNTASIDKSLRESLVLLKKPSLVIGGKDMSIGIKALHSTSSVYVDPEIMIVNNTSSSGTLEDLFSIIECSGKDSANEGGSLLVRTGVDAEISITTIPEKHFEFHSALGVPDDTIDMAQRSFTALASHLDLPYNLQTF